MGWLKMNGPIVDLFDYSCKFPRIAGVQPFVLKGMQLKVSKLLALYDIMLVILILAIDALLLYINSSVYIDPVTSFVRTAQQLSSSVTITVSLLWIFQSKSSLELALVELVKFEDIVQPKGMFLRARMLGSIYTVLFIIASIDFSLCGPGIPIVSAIFLILRFHFASWMMFSVCANFTFFIKIVDKSYRALSEFVILSLKAPQQLKNIQKAAEHLVSASEALNAAFGPQMLLITSACFVLITGNTYMAIMSGFDDSFNSLCWIFIFTKMMLHLISSCTSAVQAAEEFEKTLYRKVLEDRSGQLSQEVRSCLHFTNNRKVEFNAFGFFTIDFTLAGSMIAAATTYLVILIQMGKSEEAEANTTTIVAPEMANDMKNLTL